MCAQTICISCKSQLIVPGASGGRLPGRVHTWADSPSLRMEGSFQIEGRVAVNAQN